MKEKIYKYVVVRAESKREGTHLFRAQMVVQPPCGQRLYPFSQSKMSTFTGTNLPSPIFGHIDFNYNLWGEDMGWTAVDTPGCRVLPIRRVRR